MFKSCQNRAVMRLNTECKSCKKHSALNARSRMQLSSTLLRNAFNMNSSTFTHTDHISAKPTLPTSCTYFARLVPQRRTLFKRRDGSTSILHCSQGATVFQGLMETQSSKPHAQKTQTTHRLDTYKLFTTFKRLECRRIFVASYTVHRKSILSNIKGTVACSKQRPD